MMGWKLTTNASRERFQELAKKQPNICIKDLQTEIKALKDSNGELQTNIDNLHNILAGHIARQQEATDQVKKAEERTEQWKNKAEDQQKVNVGLETALADEKHMRLKAESRAVAAESKLNDLPTKIQEAVTLMLSGSSK
jgi:chromosome segregation ATPase